MGDIFDSIGKGISRAFTLPGSGQAAIGAGSPPPALNGVAAMPRAPDILTSPATPQAPAEIPDPSSATAMQSARKTAATKANSAGRAATIMTRPGTTGRSTPAPTGDYSRATLAAG